MEYISIIINEDASHDCLADLGKLGVIQFTDVRCVALCLWSANAVQCSTETSRYFSCILMVWRSF